MKLEVGQAAPPVEGMTLDGAPFALAELLGRPVHLAFHRFTGCPVCRFHLSDFTRRYDEIRSAGLTTVVVFHSPRARAEKDLGPALPYPVVLDPERVTYEAYGVSAGVGGLATLGMLTETVRAASRGHWPRVLGIHGPLSTHPADFLVDESGIIRFARYGSDIVDSLTVDDVLELSTG